MNNSGYSNHRVNQSFAKAASKIRAFAPERSEKGEED